jgi:DNA-binding transcriptional LysR family regulator
MASPPPRFSLRHLRYFAAVGQTGSVTRAAALLNVSPPSVSAAVSHLEKVFSIQLFIRHHAKGLVLTPTGRRFLREVIRLQAQVDDLHQFASKLSDVVAGDLDIGCFLTLAPIVMPSLLRAFRAANPEARISFHEGNQAELMDGIRHGRFELALTYHMQLSDDMDFERLASLPPYVILPAEHPIARGAAASLADLADQPMILLDLPISRDYFASLFGVVGLSPKIVHRTSSPEVVRAFVANGFGYSVFCAPHKCDIAADGHRFVARPLTDRLAPLDVGIIQLAQSKRTRAASVFVDLCHRAATEWRLVA